MARRVNKVGRRDPGEVYSPKIRRKTRRLAGIYQRTWNNPSISGGTRTHKAARVRALKLRLEKLGVRGAGAEDFLLTGPSKGAVGRQLKRAKRTGYY